MAENDEIGEFLLSKLITQVKEDTALLKIARKAVLPREEVQNYFKKSLLDNYFDYYDVEISVFDPSGNSLSNVDGSSSYAMYEKRV